MAVMSDHTFERRQGRTYWLCTKCGLVKGLPVENEARPCDPAKLDKRMRLERAQIALTGRERAQLDGRN
jgi:hypothetical protein